MSSLPLRSVLRVLNAARSELIGALCQARRAKSMQTSIETAKGVSSQVAHISLCNDTPRCTIADCRIRPLVTDPLPADSDCRKFCKFASRPFPFSGRVESCKRGPQRDRQSASGRCLNKQHSNAHNSAKGSNKSQLRIKVHIAPALQSIVAQSRILNCVCRTFRVASAPCTDRMRARPAWTAPGL